MKAIDVLRLMAGSEAGGTTSVDIGDNVAYSLMLDRASTQYLTRTVGSAATDGKKWTCSFWVKRCGLDTEQTFLFGGSSNPREYFEFNTSNQIEVGVTGGSSAGTTSTALFRDTSAWMHVVIVYDSTQASATDRIKVYTNNIEDTGPSATSMPSLNAVSKVTTNGESNVLGTYVASSTAAANLYLADYILVDGQALTPSSFGRTSADTGAWVHKDYAGTYGNNGFRLDFSNSADLGNDVSGNNNDWTTNGGISSANQYTDTPTNNFCVLNPIVQGLGYVPKVGNLTNYFIASAGVYNPNKGSMSFPSTGKWYFEVTANNTSTGTVVMGAGICSNAAVMNGVNQGGGTGVWNINWDNFRRLYYNGTQSSSSSATITAGDIIQVAVDRDAGKAWFGHNNTWYDTASTTAGDPSAGTNPNVTGITGDLYPHLICGYSTESITANFGQGANMTGVSYRSAAGGYFKYAPPTDFKALCTANLTAPAIIDPSDHFFAKTRTGTGASYSVTGLNFQPDLVWVKGRSGATDHAIYDAVRGATYQLESNTTTDETTEATGLTAFNSDGYSGGALAQMNTNTATYIDWMWNESVTAGLDIVSYTGNGANRTINHGLGVVPKMIIIKSRATAGADTNWAVYHASLANTEYLLLNSTGAKATGATYWNSTTPTSSVFSLGTHADVNTNSDTYIAYCFAEIEGFSKFGSYTGNGSTDGVFVYCGFRPRWIMTKCSSTTGDWRIYDTARPGYNVQGGTLLADTAGAETTTAELDILSNGFKARITTDPNSAQTFVFAAFSELPMKYATAR